VSILIVRYLINLAGPRNELRPLDRRRSGRGPAGGIRPPRV